VHEYVDACGSLSLLQEAYNLSIPDLIAGKVVSKEPLSGKRLELEGTFKLSWVEMFQVRKIVKNNLLCILIQLNHGFADWSNDV
jgi:hypothetical protein